MEKRPVGKKRLLSCAELVLDVDTKTQRVILKKKVRLASGVLAAWNVPARLKVAGNREVCGELVTAAPRCAGAGEAVPAVEDDRFGHVVSRRLVPATEQTRAAASAGLLPGAGHRWARRCDRQQVCPLGGATLLETGSAWFLLFPALSL